MRDRIQEILIKRVAFTVAALLFVHGRRKAAPLLGLIGQFAKPIRKLNAASINFKTFGDARIRRFRTRQRRLRRRIFEQYRQTPLPQIGFDMLDQYLAEDVGPGVVIADPYLVRRHSRERSAIAVTVRDCRQ